MKNYFTIITPSYNRSEYLLILYRSLKEQNKESFEWIIVDDGSTDDTKGIVNNIIQNDNNIKIKYIYKENGGKHSAVNRGINEATGEYITIIDSDDYLVPNGLTKIRKIIEDNVNADFIGISACKIDKKGNSISFTNTISEQKMTHYEWFYKHKRTGDRIDFYKSDIIKKYQFNIFQNEKFLTEDTLWLTIKGDKIYTNQQILVCEYLESGLTSNYDNLLKHNPLGMVYYYSLLLSQCKTNKEKYKFSALLIFYSLTTITQKTSLLNSFITFMTMPLICIIKFLKK